MKETYSNTCFAYLRHVDDDIISLLTSARQINPAHRITDKPVSQSQVTAPHPGAQVSSETSSRVRMSTMLVTTSEVLL